jgi:hypothetical protein
MGLPTPRCKHGQHMQLNAAPLNTPPPPAWLRLRPLPTIAGVAALGLGLRRQTRARPRVDDLRLADHKAVLHQLADVLPCGWVAQAQRAGRW